MARIDVPADQDPLLYLWSGTGNKLTGPAAAFSDAVYRKSTLPLREFEAARITIARVNNCNICLTLRPEGGPDQAFYDAVLGAGADLTEREALAKRHERRAATHNVHSTCAHSGSAVTDATAVSRRTNSWPLSQRI